MLRRILTHQRPIRGSSSSSRIITGRSNPLLLLSAFDDGSDPTNQPFQVRWKRNDGNSSFMEPRRSTPKQKKEHRKRQRENFQATVGKHSAPNSKASIRRQHDEEVRQEYLKWDEPEVAELDYNYGDALLDDLMGNTANLTSTPTPQPVYLGDKHKVYYNAVAFQMESYKEAIEQMDSEKEQTAVVDMSELPTDHAISMVARSYRDSHGTRLKPVGVAKVLAHLLKDLGLPISTFGEETFTSILTCCATPKEARRILRLMKDVQHPISSYSWSILVDIHAKLGDFQGCDQVLREMVMEGVPPTLPAYTSLLAACYKVCNAGHLPPSVRAEAGKLGWAKWKEMRIVGVNPDVMAYGAILRLCAARGHAEQSLNLLDEMPTFQVKPTALCFASSLKAIARSHQIAIRFENGASKRYRKRQGVAAYHGKMTRQVVIAAEASEVELDDGFIAALVLCAGAAGDSATAKAILLASEIRKLDHLRTIGSNKHLQELGGQGGQDMESLSIDAQLSQLFLNDGLDAAELMAGESTKELTLSGADSMLAEMNGEVDYTPQSYAEREYGKDSRVLSALMQACSQAVDSKGLGTMWEGRDNKGYLCENSLRMLTVKPEPTYMDNDIPGVSSTDVGLGSLTYEEEDPDLMTKRLRRAKFEGIDMDDSGTTMDDLDPYFYNMFKDDDPALKRGNPDATEEELPLDDSAWDIGAPKQIAEAQTTNVSSQPKEEWYFDLNERKWKTRELESALEEFPHDEGEVNEDDSFAAEFGSDEPQWDPLEGQSQMFFDATAGRIQDAKDQNQKATAEETSEEWYFDQNERKWKTRPREAGGKKLVQPVLTQYEAESLSEEEQNSVISYPNSTKNYRDASDMMPQELPKPDFDEFVSMLQHEIKDSGETLDFSEEEARHLFQMMDNKSADTRGPALQKELEEFVAMKTNGEEDVDSSLDENFLSEQEHEDKTGMLDDEHTQLMELMKSMGMEVSVEDESGDDDQDTPDWMQQEDVKEAMSVVKELTSDPAEVVEDMSSDTILTAHPVGDEPDYMMEELKSVLSGMPEQRIQKVANAFKKNLGYPSFLTLTPMLRENMPERVTADWLKRKNVQNAYFVMEKAKEDGMADVHMMNGMLQVETSTGSIDRALACHEARFQQHGLKPTQYSDRLVLQMLVKNDRLARALQFKDKVEDSGRKLDVISYGTLIEHYAKRRQIGSALMMLKECVNAHDSPPNEHSLNALRRLCRHQHLTEKVGLHELAGPDPLEWLREGEATLKREYSKAGRRDVLIPKNKSVHI